MKRGHSNNLDFFLSNMGKVYMSGSVNAPHLGAGVSWKLHLVSSAQDKRGEQQAVPSRDVPCARWDPHDLALGAVGPRPDLGRSQG